MQECKPAELRNLDGRPESNQERIQRRLEYLMHVLFLGQSLPNAEEGVDGNVLADFENAGYFFQSQ